MHRIDSPIALVGFMGAGKTTVGRLLGIRMGWPAIDMDEWIVKAEGRPISEIFDKDGETYFRKIERQLLFELIRGCRIVISTGGGTFVQDRNTKAMRDNCRVIWLQVDLETVESRLNGDKGRPLAQDPSTMAIRFTERYPVYARAHIHIDASLAPEEVVERIFQKLCSNAI